MRTQAAICQQALGIEQEGARAQEQAGMADAFASAPSLSQDLGGALGDSSWADVKFVAGGRPIFAHIGRTCGQP